MVAVEVRKLAERSQVAAQEIGSLASSSVSTAERAGRLFSEIVPSIRRTADLVQEIAAASREQSTGLDQINSAVGQVSQTTQTNASASEQLSSTAESMSGRAMQLQSMMQFFRVAADNDNGISPANRQTGPKQVFTQGPRGRAKSETRSRRQRRLGPRLRVRELLRPAMPQGLSTRRDRAAGGTEGPALQYLTFVLGKELMAAAIGTIREVIEYSTITRIPLASPCVPGVLNLRGAVLPVVDLSVRLGRSPTVLGRRNCVIIVETDSDEGMQLVGVIVDAVSEALEVQPSQLERRPAFGTGLRADFVDSMLKVDERFITVIDMAAILSMRELEQLINDELHVATDQPRLLPAVGGAGSSWSRSVSALFMR